MVSRRTGMEGHKPGTPLQRVPYSSMPDVRRKLASWGEVHRGNKGIGGQIRWRLVGQAFLLGGVSDPGSRGARWDLGRFPIDLALCSRSASWFS
jgi:hypothetical protein